MNITEVNMRWDKTSTGYRTLELPELVFFIMLEVYFSPTADTV